MLLKAKLYVVVTCILFLLFSNSVIRGEQSNNRGERIVSPIMSDIPMRDDLIHYFKVIRQILNFTSAHENFIDLNYYLGLFLVQVNLEYAFKAKAKSMPDYVWKEINSIRQQNGQLLKFFTDMVELDDDPKDKHLKQVFRLISNITTWTERLRRYGGAVLTGSKSDSNKLLERKYSSWVTYTRRVDNVYHYAPTPKQSDKCMSSLAQNFNPRHDALLKCVTTAPCYNIILNGSDFGYALTHRILLLLMARIGSGCFFFSRLIDREVTKRLCSAAYNEASYIAINDFKSPDLLFEQISLCTLENQSQFLRRTWLKELMRYKTNYGCFSELKRAVKQKTVDHKWQIIRRNDHTLLGGVCNSHVTAVAAASYASAIRFVIMAYY